jgi:hypothetical protein
MAAAGRWTPVDPLRRPGARGAACGPRDATRAPGPVTGRYRARQWGAYREKLAQLLGLAPFRFSSPGGGGFDPAITQDRQAGKTPCRSLSTGVISRPWKSSAFGV